MMNQFVLVVLAAASTTSLGCLPTFKPTTTLDLPGVARWSNQKDLDLIINELDADAVDGKLKIGHLALINNATNPMDAYARQMAQQVEYGKLQIELARILSALVAQVAPLYVRPPTPPSTSPTPTSRSVFPMLPPEGLNLPFGSSVLQDGTIILPGGQRVRKAQ